MNVGDRITGAQQRCDVCYTYVLRCPDTDEVKYVGSAQNPQCRYAQHLQEACGRIFRNKRISWIRNLLIHGKFPVMEIVYIGTYVEAAKQEQKLFLYHADLLNEAPPGKRSNHPRLSPEKWQSRAMKAVTRDLQKT